MNKKKVLFVATITEHISQFHQPHLKFFQSQKYETNVASNGKQDIKFCDKHFDINFKRFPINIANIKAYKKLKNIIDENEYELIHCHTPVGGLLTRLAARKARKNGTKVIYTAHGFHFYKGAPILNWIIYYPIEKFLSKYTDAIITINKEDYKIAKEKFHSKQLYYIPGVGVEKEKFDINMGIEEINNKRDEVGFSEEDYICIIVGELNKNKNQEMAIKAFEGIKEEKIKLLIVGAGPLENYYEKLIMKYGLYDRIKLLGYRKDIPQLLKISNVLLSLSYREGLPVNVIEAMASGVPVIATNCRGNSDLVINGHNGYIISINDVQELQNKITILYNDKSNKYKEYSSIEFEKYNMDSVLNDYIKVYRTLLKEQ